MSLASISEPIRIGLFTNEPVRLAGLATISEVGDRDLRTEECYPRLVPVAGAAETLLADFSLECLVVDLHSSCTSLKTLELIRRARPDVRVIVIGPAGDDGLILESVKAGARAYLDSNATPEIVRKAVEVVNQGSIWIPRRLLSKLVDQLLTPDTTVVESSPRLTSREQQVLELILLARSNREIARKLGIEERTVKAHVGRLMRKTGAENRIELCMRALSLELLPNGDLSEHLPVSKLEASIY